MTTYRDAIKEGLCEEMARDKRVVLFGEDVAEYGRRLQTLERYARGIRPRPRPQHPDLRSLHLRRGGRHGDDRLPPVAELMYMDFALMSSDQISNQAAKWHYMTGASTEVPLVVRCSVGGGKGYGGQHSQSLESMFAHIPGTYVAYPSNPYDAKGMIKTAVRTNNPGRLRRRPAALQREGRGAGRGLHGAVRRGEHRP